MKYKSLPIGNRGGHRVLSTGWGDLSFTRDVIGPPTRNVTDAAIMLGAIAGSDPRDAESSNNSVPKYPFVSAANPVNARTSSAALLDSPSFFKLTAVFIRPSKTRW